MWFRSPPAKVRSEAVKHIQSPLVTSRWASCFLSHPKSRQFIPNRQTTTKKEDTISVIAQLLLYSLHLCPQKRVEMQASISIHVNKKLPDVNLGVFLLPTPLTTYCRAFTTKLSSLSSMGTSPPFPRLRNPDIKTQLNSQKQGYFRKKNYLCRTQRQPLPNDTGELQITPLE